MTRGVVIPGAVIGGAAASVSARAAARALILSLASAGLAFAEDWPGSAGRIFLRTHARLLAIGKSRNTP